MSKSLSSGRPAEEQGVERQAEGDEAGGPSPSAQWEKGKACQEGTAGQGFFPTDSKWGFQALFNVPFASVTLTAWQGHPGWGEKRKEREK